MHFCLKQVTVTKHMIHLYLKLQFILRNKICRRYMQTCFLLKSTFLNLWKFMSDRYQQYIT